MKTKKRSYVVKAIIDGCTVYITKVTAKSESDAERKIFDAVNFDIKCHACCCKLLSRLLFTHLLTNYNILTFSEFCEIVKRKNAEVCNYYGKC